MRERQTVVLVHGGLGSYDHSYFKPHFARLTSSSSERERSCRDPTLLRSRGVISVTPRGRQVRLRRPRLVPPYLDAAAAFRAHGEFLQKNRRYAPAFTVRADPYAFGTEVARAGYATDPSYARVLHGVMRSLESAGFR